MSRYKRDRDWTTDDFWSIGDAKFAQLELHTQEPMYMQIYSIIESFYKKENIRYVVKDPSCFRND